MQFSSTIQIAKDPTHLKTLTGQRARRHDQLVGWSERIALGVDLFDQVLRGETALADVLHRPVHVQRLGFAGAFRQVDPENLARITHRLAPSRASVCGGCLDGAVGIARVGFFGPHRHLGETGLLDVGIRDRLGWARFGASRFTLAHVALDDLAG